MEKNTQKPLIVEIEEAKKEITEAVNNALQNHNLPCYLIEPIISMLAMQIKDGAKSELAMAKAQMDKKEDGEQ